ncbi:3-oxoacyl-[acyl-carrier-protein] synthase, mitochondrial [Fusarium oxysporum f. sp. cubense race 1]|uniref:beta-ketoacyl-[acyl-carrier-protein] synthase I n=1 Tax=Fusarium oxysporum f. sp. cubense (strain race 1) TaxID=1229664 RepID=N4U668_FUSC1|nr:3-oxoacyl-[acyl-carrier-protein] synthase, mitochondrial [Fusarium oxysporum f. sp. cubense race 1]
MRRVVVTGLGAITPLGVGIRRTWTRLINNECGIVSVADLEPQARWKELTSTVSGLVPSGDGEGRWRASDWVNANEQRRMSKFTQYAIAASDMALRDSGWEPKNAEQQEATGVCLGSGIGNLDEIYETSLVHHQDGYKKVSPLFVPKILINMAAGHVAMKYGFQGPNHTATTACTTGAHSIGDAARFITMGDADVMVAGGIRPSQVDYINAHATATHVGDVAETSAIKRIMLGEEGHQKESDVTVSSTKGAVGHLLGAAGAIEALFCILAIHEGVVPATLNLQKPDVGAAFNFVPNEAQEKTVGVAVSNSFGFGGTNSSLVFSRYQ